MRRNELDYLLSTMLDSHPSVSDLLLTVDKPLQDESAGLLVPVQCNPTLDKLTPFQTESAAMNLVGHSSRLLDDLLRTGSCDASYTLTNKARFRINVFCQRGHYSVVLRKLNTEIPSLSSLSLPDIFHQVAKEKIGMVLVTGAPGPRKTTSPGGPRHGGNQTKTHRHS